MVLFVSKKLFLIFQEKQGHFETNFLNDIKEI